MLPYYMDEPRIWEVIREANADLARERVGMFLTVDDRRVAA
jgi:hypothetical protein